MLNLAKLQMICYQIYSVIFNSPLKRKVQKKLFLMKEKEITVLKDAIKI